MEVMDMLVCGVCEDKFTELTSFINHKKEFTEVYNCRRCDKMFHKLSDCQTHELEQHRTGSDHLNSANKLDYGSNESCDECVTSINNEESCDENTMADNTDMETTNIILTTDDNDLASVDNICDDNGSFIVHVCKMCLNFAVSKELIVKHIVEFHPQFEGTVNENIDVVSPVNDSADAQQLNITVVSNVMPAKKRGRPRKNVSSSKFSHVKYLTSWTCIKCKETFSTEKEDTEHNCVLTDENINDEVVTGDDDSLILANQDIEKYLTNDNSDDTIECSVPVFLSAQGQECDIDFEKEIPKKPVFDSESDRRKFEENLDVVEDQSLSGMFTKHAVRQKLATSEKLRADLMIFSCKECKKVFKSESHIRDHCRSHANIRSFRCFDCDFSCAVRSNLLSHMRLHTGNVYKCTRCEYQDINRHHVVDHMQKTHFEKRLKCKICGCLFQTVIHLTDHVRSVHDNSSNGSDELQWYHSTHDSGIILHSCHVCKRKFKRQKDRNRHLLTHNINVNGFNCKFCDHVASRYHYLKNHYRRHSLVYECILCGDVKLSSIILKQHLTKHFQRYLIDQNEEIARNSLALNSNVNDGSDDVENIQIPAGATMESLYELSIEKSWYLPEPATVKALNQNINLPDHLVKDATMHSHYFDDIFLNKDETIGDNENISSNVQKKETEEDKNLVMTDPIRAFGYKQLTLPILKTIRETFGDFECHVCGRLFHNNIYLKRHFFVHVSEKPFKCTQCDYSSSTKENLKRHTEVFHEGKTFTCDICGDNFPSKTGLWSHKQSHSTTQLFCSRCDERFENIQKFRKHLIDKHPDMSKEEAKELTGMTKHSYSYIGRQSYKCPYCDRLFHGSMSDLQKHMWIHEGIKPFKCSMCPYASRSKHNLNNHMLRHCDFKPYLCEDCGKAYKSKPALKAHINSHQLSDKKSVKNLVMDDDLPSPMEVIDNVEKDLLPNMNNSNYVFKCLSCEEIFDSIESSKQHFKDKHSINVNETNMSDDQRLANIQIDDDMPDPFINVEPNVNQTSVDFNEMETMDEKDEQIQVTMPPPDSVHKADEKSVKEETANAEAILDEKAASAVNIIQQIIQGGLTQTNQNTMSEDGQTFIVSSGSQSGQKFIIQYVASAEC